MDSLILIALGILIVGCLLRLATMRVRNRVIDSWPFVIVSVFGSSVALLMITIALLIQFDL